MKGQVPIVEVIISIIIAFVAFNILFTGGQYQTKWNDATSLLHGRDILTTADRLGQLHNYAFSETSFNSFIGEMDVSKDVLIKLETQGTLKSTMYIACDCTSEQLAYLQNVLGDVKLNNRQVNVNICSTTLPAINSCGSGTQYPDVLVIWGYRDLTSYISVLSDFISNGNSAVEIADVPHTKVNNLGNDEDEGQKRIFGTIYIAEGNFPNNQDEFIAPTNAQQLTFKSYRWFYHLPYLLTGTSDAVSFQMESGSTVTCNGKTGNLKFRDNSYQFWICSDSKAYFDTTTPQNNKADVSVSEGERFSISSSNFLLSYVELPNKIRITFKPDYQYNDFIVKDNGHNKLALASPDNKSKTLLSMGFWDNEEQKPIAAVIFNGTENGKSVWIADFSRDGLSATGDDHKQLLSSLILSIASKKSTVQSILSGQITSYINVVSKDMMEVYRVDLAIGKPF
ncbi:MAG: hypothetical protein HYW24_02675 [Candidatus Aenigmarchaeota archaeon]|nr:hypothetical protein [Candidatus Aenigmarchaeota archaeon]